MAVLVVGTLGTRVAKTFLIRVQHAVAAPRDFGLEPKLPAGFA